MAIATFPKKTFHLFLITTILMCSMGSQNDKSRLDWHYSWWYCNYCLYLQFTALVDQSKSAKYSLLFKRGCISSQLLSQI